MDQIRFRDFYESKPPDNDNVIHVDFKPKKKKNNKKKPVPDKIKGAFSKKFDAIYNLQNNMKDAADDATKLLYDVFHVKDNGNNLDLISRKNKSKTLNIGLYAWGAVGAFLSEIIADKNVYKHDFATKLSATEIQELKNKIDEKGGIFKKPPVKYMNRPGLPKNRFILLDSKWSDGRRQSWEYVIDTKTRKKLSFPLYASAEILKALTFYFTAK